MTVLFVLPGLLAGGAERQLLSLLARRPRTLDVHLVVFVADDPRAMRQLADTGVVVHCLDRPEGSFPAFFGRLVRTVREVRPRIVHTVLAGSTGTWGRLAALVADVPHVFHSDRSLDPPVSSVHRLLRPALDARTERLFVNAEAIAAWLVARGVEPEKLRVIPNGVDLERFAPSPDHDARRAWGVDGTALVAGFLGRLRPEKRVDLLLSALVATPEALRPDVVLIGGDGPQRSALEAAVQADRWLRTHCRFLGPVDDAPRFLAALDFLVLPSDIEGCPNVVLEALAMGKPVVATAVSDVPRLVEGCGLLARPGDRASLSHALASMQRLSAGERRQLGATGRARVEGAHDLRSAARRFWDAHLEVLT